MPSTRGCSRSHLNGACQSQPAAVAVAVQLDSLKAKEQAWALLPSGEVLLVVHAHPTLVLAAVWGPVWLQPALLAAKNCPL